MLACFELAGSYDARAKPVLSSSASCCLRLVKAFGRSIHFGLGRMARRAHRRNHIRLLPDAGSPSLPLARHERVSIEFENSTPYTVSLGLGSAGTVLVSPEVAWVRRPQWARLNKRRCRMHGGATESRHAKVQPECPKYAVKALAKAAGEDQLNKAEHTSLAPLTADGILAPWLRVGHGRSPDARSDGIMVKTGG